MSRFLRTLIAALTLAALLGAPGISAADSSVGSLWRFLTGPFLKAGCLIDPFGRCMTGTAPATTDAGCRIDPNGSCAPKRRVITKAGCRIDPDGHCVTSPSVAGDAGCLIDPNGRCRPGS